MTAYVISVLVVAVGLTIAELIIPSGKLKGTVKVVLSIIFLAVMIQPIANLDISSAVNFDSFENYKDDSVVFYVEKNMKSYYESLLYNELLICDLVAEKVNVEVCNTEITKVEIYLSNLVIDENYEHINISVIKNYISDKLSIDGDILSVYG